MRFLPLLLLLAVSFSGAGNTGEKYFVSFRDRVNTPYSLEQPEAFLSERSLQRRAKQGIALREWDLPVNPLYLERLQAAGATIVGRSRWLNGAVVEITDSLLPARLAQLNFVDRVQPLQRGAWPSLIDKLETFPGNGSPHPSSRLIEYEYGNSYNQQHMIASDYLHAEGYDGKGLVIALLDAGFYRVDSLPAFDSLRARNGILGTWDFVANEADVYNDHTHGMNVLSCISANLPGSLMGSAPGASVYLLRTENSSSETLAEEYSWVAAAEYADSAGADILSSSLGYSTFDDPNQNHTYAELDGHSTVVALGANHAASVGILVVVSAGNNGAASWNYISTPADADSALAVGAVDKFGAYASFSSNGPAADGDVKPNVAAQGKDPIVYYANGTVGPGSGTSFAAPILAGAAACFWQAFDTLTCMEVFDRIQQCSNRYTHPDTLTGYGIPNFMSAYTLMKTKGGSVPAPDGILNAYPVPWHNDLNIIFNSSVEGMGQARIYDMLGKLVHSEEMPVFIGLQDLRLNIRNMSSGVYFFELSLGDSHYIRTLMAGPRP